MLGLCCNIATCWHIRQQFVSNRTLYNLVKRAFHTVQHLISNIVIDMLKVTAADCNNKAQSTRDCRNVVRVVNTLTARHGYGTMMMTMMINFWRLLSEKCLSVDESLMMLSLRPSIPVCQNWSSRTSWISWVCSISCDLSLTPLHIIHLSPIFCECIYCPSRSSTRKGEAAPPICSSSSDDTDLLTSMLVEWWDIIENERQE